MQSGTPPGTTTVSGYGSHQLVRQLERRPRRLTRRRCLGAPPHMRISHAIVLRRTTGTPAPAGLALLPSELLPYPSFHSMSLYGGEAARFVKALEISAWRRFLEPVQPLVIRAACI